MRVLRDLAEGVPIPVPAKSFNHRRPQRLTAVQNSLQRLLKRLHARKLEKKLLRQNPREKLAVRRDRGNDRHASRRESLDRRKTESLVSGRNDDRRAVGVKRSQPDVIDNAEKNAIRTGIAAFGRKCKDELVGPDRRRAKRALSPPFGERGDKAAVLARPRLRSHAEKITAWDFETLAHGSDFLDGRALHVPRIDGVGDDADLRHRKMQARLDVTGDRAAHGDDAGGALEPLAHRLAIRLDIARIKPVELVDRGDARHLRNPGAHARKIVKQPRAMRTRDQRYFEIRESAPHRAQRRRAAKRGLDPLKTVAVRPARAADDLSGLRVGVQNVELKLRIDVAQAQKKIERVPADSG